MRDDNGDLVDRPQPPSLGAVGAEAGPLMDVVSGALIGGVMGKRSGEVIAAGGEITDRGIRRSGAEARRDVEIVGYVLNDQVSGHGRLVAGAMHYGGAAAANMRLAYGQVESLADRSLGTVAQWSSAVSGAIDRAESHLPFMGGLREAADANDQATAVYVEHRRAEATRHQRDARRDAQAIRQIADDGASVAWQVSSAAGQTLQRGAGQLGETIDVNAGVVGSSIRNGTGRAPEALAAVRMLGGGATVAAGELAGVSITTIAQTGYVREHGAGSVSEAIGRHGVHDVVLPSLDARTREMEGRAMERMGELQARSATSGRRPLTPEQSPHALVQRMLDSAQSGDWHAFRRGTQALADMPAGRALRAEAATQVDQQQQAERQQAQEVQQTMPRGMTR